MGPAEPLDLDPAEVVEHFADALEVDPDEAESEDEGEPGFQVLDVVHFFGGHPGGADATGASSSSAGPIPAPPPASPAAEPQGSISISEYGYVTATGMPHFGSAVGYFVAKKGTIFCHCHLHRGCTIRRPVRKASQLHLAAWLASGARVDSDAKKAEGVRHMAAYEEDPALVE